MINERKKKKRSSINRERRDYSRYDMTHVSVIKKEKKIVIRPILKRREREKKGMMIN